MPELPPFNPSVSVFHFTSKVSSAKIRKYKLATERGMTLGHAKRKSSSPKPAAGIASSSTGRGEPAAKKPRLKLNVREPKTIDDDTIAVANKRSRASAGMQHEFQTFPIDQTGLDSKAEGKTKATNPPAASQKLTSLPSPKQPTSADEPTPGSAKESYGDFMSYYILDGTDDDVENGKAETQGSKRLKPSTAVKARHSYDNGHPPAQQAQHDPSSGAVKEDRAHTRPRQSRMRANPPSLPQAAPIVQVPIIEEIKVDNPDPINIMIQKLRTLSAALTDFGGVPPVPASPGAPEKDSVAEKESMVTNFLAMFQDDKDSKGDGDDGSRENPREFGLQDGPLTYGIQFIMNALKSWAQQRLHQQHMQLVQANQSPPEDLSQRRGPGRPRKPSIELANSPSGSRPGQPMAPAQVDLYQTPEGRAIAAFRAVVESGCLRVNAVLPADLARALRHLYLQIDHLINQGSKAQEPWRCMSYSAQIVANKVRVDKWKEAQAKAQEEMIRQQQLAHQQVMRQMGLPPQSTATMFYQQPHDPTVLDSEGKTASQHLVRLPINPQPLSHPPLPYTRVSGSPLTTGPSPSPTIGSTAGGAFLAGASASGLNAPSTHRLSMSPQVDSLAQSGSSSHLERMKSLVPGYLPRSGQSMKFSFAPKSDAALQAFGAQAFPALNQSATNIPNRGPMPPPSLPVQESKSMAIPHDADRNGSHADIREAGEDVIMSDVDETLNRRASAGNNGFTAVNARSLSASPVMPASAIDASTSAQAPAIASAPSVTQKRPHNATKIASRFPHPGAVVIDQ